MPRNKSRRKTVPVLIVEDDAVCAGLIAKILRKLGFAPLLAGDLREARRILAEHDPGLVLLDRHLRQGADGLSLCLELKKDPRTRLIPVIVLTALDEFSEKIKGIRYGADLYLRKPVDLAELEKYVKAFTRRLPYKNETEGRLRCGDVVLSKADRTLRVGRRVYRSLPAKQFDLLALLIAGQGGCVSRRFLVRKLWRNGVRDKEVDVLVSRLKRRLGKTAAALISPVRSHGYRLALPSSRPRAAA